MADVTIGGVVYGVTLPNFKALKAAWRYIGAVQGAADPMAGIDAILGIVSVGSATPVTTDQLEEALAPSEMAGLRPFMNALMIEIGLAAPPGEAQPSTEAASPSTETSTPSSPNSSPPAARPEAGTA